MPFASNQFHNYLIPLIVLLIALFTFYFNMRVASYRHSKFLRFAATILPLVGILVIWFFLLPEDYSFQRRSPSPAFDPAYFSAQPTPEAAFERYLEKLEQNISETGLGIFTEASREFLRRYPPGRNQMQNAFRHFSGRPYEIHQTELYALVFYPGAYSTHSPFFLELSEQGWQIDLVTMADVIWMDEQKHWYMIDFDHPWVDNLREICDFDEQGYCQPR